MLHFVNAIVTLLHCIYHMQNLHHNLQDLCKYVNAIVTLLHCIYLMQSLHHNLLDLCKYVMMQSSLWKIVCTRTYEDPTLDIPEGSTRRGRSQAPCGNAPPPPPRPPVNLEQLLATQNDLMRLIVENETRHVAECQQPQHQDRDSSYSNFWATKLPVFSDVSDPLEAPSWLLTTECKFGLLHCTEYQKTLYAAQQL
jgi:hypothetical protein